MITLKIKSRRTDFQRWMRCINADNLEDYVDIPVGGGSSPEIRHTVLEQADFLGGTWDQPFVERTVYDYYYLYYRNKSGAFDKFGNGEYSDGIHIGMHRDGDVVWVDRKTNKITEKKTMKEWQGECRTAK